MEAEKGIAVGQAMDAAIRRALPAIFLGVGGFYLVAAALMPLFDDYDGPQAPLVVRWVASAVLGLAGAFVFRRWPPPTGWGNHIAGGLGIVVVANSLFLIQAAGPAFQFALVVALLAFALFLLSMRWVVGLCVLAVAGWTYLAVAAGWGPEWAPRTFNLLAFCTVAIVAQAIRLGLHRRLEVLKRHDLQRISQEHELARQRALNEQRRRIVRMTAHELATPMTSVMLQAHLLNREDLTPGQRERLDVLQRNLDRLQQTMARVVAAAQADEEAAEFYAAQAADSADAGAAERPPA